jgi:hypothetical protein
VEADTATLTLGQERQLTATVYDQFGAQYQGDTPVMFEFFSGSPTDRTAENSDGNSPATPDETCTTDNSPTCTETYTQATTAGRDLICAWIGTAPGMSLNNRNDRGTCLNERRADADDDETQADPPAPVNDRRDVVSTVWKNDPEATIVECTPETDSKVARTKHTLRCTATTGEPDSGVPNTEIDVEAQGANDPDNGNSKKSPDFTCTTNQNGVCMVSHGGGRRTRDAGLTNYIAWADADYHDDTIEADNDEERDESKTAGATAEPDTTDAVQNRWLSGAREVILNASKNNVDRGDRIRLAGRVDADNEASGCEAGQRIVLQKKDPGDKKFTNTKLEATTNNNGGYAFEDVRVWKDTIFRAAATYKGGCEKSKSNWQRVNV